MFKVRGLQATSISFALALLFVSAGAASTGNPTGIIAPVLLSPIVQISVTVNALNITYGQSANVIAVWYGGTSPYKVMWYSGPFQKCQSDSDNFRNDSVFSTRDAIVVTPPKTAWYCVYIADSKGSAALSPAAEIAVYIPTTITTSVTSATTTAGAANATSQNAIAQPAASAINLQLCGIVDEIRNVVGILALTLFLLGGILYSISHFLPTNLDFKKSLTTWSTTMLIGAVIALVIVLAAKPLLTTIISIVSQPGSGAITISC